MLAARSVVHATPGKTPSGNHMAKVMQQLGIADAMAKKTTYRPALEGGVQLLAEGEADIGIYPASEVAGVKGLTVVGPLPAGIDLIIVYGAAATTGGTGGGGSLREVHGGAGKSRGLAARRLRPAGKIAAARSPMSDTVTSIAGGAPKPVFDRLGPKFAQASGHRLNALYDSMSGIAARVAAREAFDVLVMPVPLIEAYVKDGVVRAQGRAALANIGLAVGVKAGRALPDVSSPEALRRTLAAARSLVHAPPSATPSGAQSDKVIRQLGLADALAGRVTHKVGLAGGLAMIASGEAELGIFPKSEIVSTAGVALAGPLPAELQLIITYGAGVVAASPLAEAAAAFIRFAAAPETWRVWTGCGFDPPPA